MSWYKPSELGYAVRSKLADMGFGARLFLRLLASIGGTLKRPALLRDQIHFMGNYSLAIIAVSGVFVGFVMGLQYYYGLQRFGATIPYSEGGQEPLHGVYSSTCKDIFESAIQSGERKVVDILKKINIRNVTYDEVRSIGGQSVSFLNVNTPEEYAGIK